MQVSFKYKLSYADSKITNEGHLISWEIKDLNLKFNLRFIAISTEEGFEIKPNEELQDKLKSLGFSSLSLKIRDKVIEDLLVEYLRFLFFPLCIDLIQKENKNK